MGDPIPFPATGRAAGEPSSREVTLTAVPRIARICALGLGLDELLDELCGEILALSGAQDCCLVSCPAETAAEEIWRSTAAGEWPDYREAFRAGPQFPAVLARLRADGPLAVADIALLPPDDPLQVLYGSRPPRSALLLPLKFGTRIIGVLALHFFGPAGAGRSDDRRVIEEVVAPVLSAALERRRMEERLRASEARYRFLADHALDFISLHDAAGKYLYASPAAGRLFGYRPEEMVGSPAAGFVHPDDRKKFEEGNRRLASGNAPAMTMIYRVRRKDGSHAEVETASSAVPGGRKGAPQVLRVTRDVSERKKIETRLFETQKLETIGMLAGGVAHEFNNLLVGIGGAVEMMGMLFAGNWEAQKYLSMIERNSERAVELTRQLLAYARQGKYSPRIVSLNRAVREALPILKAALPGSVELRLELDEHVPPVLADIAQLEQVVMSLCLNGGEAMPEGGVLTVRTRGQEGPLAGREDAAKTDGRASVRHLRSGAVPPGPRPLLEVSDTGCGMDPKTFDRIFEPFFSTKFVGRGMGLAAVRGIVESHEGEILVRSAPGEGTTFTIGFPPVSGAPSQKEALEAPAPRGVGTVLIADDEDDVREVVCGMLESFGYKVIEARDGADAVEIFRRRHEEIDLVVLDLMMPRMSGDRTVAEMRRISPRVRAILASGYDESGRVREIVAEGFDAFLQKPFRRGDLGRKVEEAMRVGKRPPEPKKD